MFLAEAEHTYAPGMASTSTTMFGERRSLAGKSVGTTGRRFTTESSPRPCTRRARTTRPAWFNARSGVSKKNTWRICASIGSSPRALIVDRWAVSGTESLSSMLSALRTVSSSSATSRRAIPRSGSVVVMGVAPHLRPPALWPQ